MKKIVCLLLGISLAFGSVMAFADEINLSGMTFDELVALKDQINLAIWNSQEWQEVKVPQGVWKVGEDIPAGHWSIEACPGDWANITVGNELDEYGKQVKHSFGGRYYYAQVTSETYRSYKPDNDVPAIDIELSVGDYIQVDNASVIFKPYSGKPGLGFK